MKQATLLSFLGQHQLEQHSLQLLAASRPTIRLITELDEGDSLPIGRSKIGGLPDIPPQFIWPSIDTMTVETITRFGFWKQKAEVTVSQPLSFLAQINLAEVASLDEDRALPQSGMLYFFYASDQLSWGSEPEDKSTFAVRYFPGETSALKRSVRPANLDEYGYFRACSLLLEAEISLPGLDYGKLDFLGDKAMEALYDQIYDEGEVNKLLGYPDMIQGLMEEECEEVASEAFGTLPGGNWRLLFQLDSVDMAGMQWGDVGMLYFWIKEADLAARKFDRCWMILQCT